MPDEQQRERWQEVKSIFNQALELKSIERESFLEEQATRNATLVNEVRSLLKSFDDSEDFLDTVNAPGAALRPQPLKALSVGETIGEFVILRTLGEGTAGIVYLAHQKSLDRKVALKVTASFGHEARTLAHLDHDHIVKVFSESHWTEQNAKIICMQVVSGPSLDGLMTAFERNRESELLELVPALSFDSGWLGSSQRAEFEMLSSFEKCEYLLWFSARLAEALDYAHQRGILHLDVKPANVLVSPSGRPMLTDFNVAISQAVIDEKTPEVFGGTVQYMAPEHREAFECARRRVKLPPIDARADIYSLGCVLREMFTRFECFTKNARVDFHDLKAELERIIAKCTETEPSARYQSGWALAKELDSCLELRRIAKAMPERSWLMRVAFKRPFLTLLASVLIPQVVADVLSVLYNITNTAKALSFEQQIIHQRLALAYNFFYVSIVLLFAVKKFMKMHEMVGLWDQPELSAETQREMRERIVKFPRTAIKLSILGWLPVCFYLPFGIHIIKGPVSLEVFAHFGVTFLLAGGIALAYSYLYLEFVGLRIFYPRLWRGQLRIDRQATRELAVVGRRFEIFQLLAVGAPLLGAALGILVGAAQKPLTLTLLALGIIGAFHSIRVSRMLSQTIFALTQKF